MIVARKVIQLFKLDLFREIYIPRIELYNQYFKSTQKNTSHGRIYKLSFYFIRVMRISKYLKKN